jgi:enoyl-CoA hydratase/carnithine racemase
MAEDPAPSSGRSRQLTASLEVDDVALGVHRIRLDRPERRNAIDLALVDELDAAFADVQDPVVVLGSTDPACFCAGADLGVSDEERAAVSDRLYALYRRMIDLESVIVVAVTGHAVGGGAQLAIAGDLRVANPQTRLRFPGPGHGLTVGAWGLPSLVGRGRALDLCLTMREVGAEEALAIGLVDRVSDDVDATAMELAVGLAALDRGALQRTKAIVLEATSIRRALDLERARNQGWSGEVPASARRPP